MRELNPSLNNIRAVASHDHEALKIVIKILQDALPGHAGIDRAADLVRRFGVPWKVRVARSGKPRTMVGTGIEYEEDESEEEEEDKGEEDAGERSSAAPVPPVVPPVGQLLWSNDDIENWNDSAERARHLAERRIVLSPVESEEETEKEKEKDRPEGPVEVEDVEMGDGDVEMGNGGEGGDGSGEKPVGGSDGRPVTPTGEPVVTGGVDEGQDGGPVATGASGSGPEGPGTSDQGWSEMRSGLPTINTSAFAPRKKPSAPTFKREEEDVPIASTSGGGEESPVGPVGGEGGGEVPMDVETPATSPAAPAAAEAGPVAPVVKLEPLDDEAFQSGQWPEGFVPHDSIDEHGNLVEVIHFDLDE